MAPSKKLYTLTEVSKVTGISMPTLLRYKRLYQDRIPSEGEGRRQRYPSSALPVFRKIRQESGTRSGGGAKTGGKSGKKSRKKSGAATKQGRSGGVKREPRLLTLLEIGRRTGISYPTLLRYVKLHSDEIPHVGTGRRRRYPPKAVGVFRQLRRASKRGPRAGTTGGGRRAVGSDPALSARVRELEKAQRQVNRQLEEILRLLKEPLRITVRSD